MAFNGFLAGVFTSLAIVALLSPWLHRLPWIASLAASRRRALAGAVTLALLAFGAYRLQPVPAPASAAATSSAARSFGEAARLINNVSAPAAAKVATAPATATTSAGPMESAITNLEARLTKSGGGADDWELLAKSFEFLGRPADAARARAHQLPPVSDAAKPSAAAAGVIVSGEVTLDASLTTKAKPGETLFIVAKSVDSPGIPVAVFRGSVGSWPLRFTLDDSQSMMPGRTLATAGRVTIEARISHNGQPMPSPGDLQGSSGVIDPAARKALSIRIDKVIS